MADSAEFSAFSQRELRSLAKTFDLMGEKAVEKSKATAFDIASLAKREIATAGYGRTVNNKGVRRVVDGASISRTSKTGRLSMVLLVSVFQVAAAQRFSGAVLNLDQRTLDSSQPSAVDWDGAQKVISYFQPFAKFSLN